MVQFYDLSVADIKKTIRDAVVVTLKPDDPDAFDFVQGQYLTFRKEFDGEELRRSYSICTGKDDGPVASWDKKSCMAAHFRPGPTPNLKLETRFKRCHQWAISMRLKKLRAGAIVYVLH